MAVVRIPLPRPWSWRESAFIAEFYSRPKYNLHSWLLAWTGIFYFTRPLSECKGFYTPLDDQQCFLSFEINSLNRESWSQSLINFRCFTSLLTLRRMFSLDNSTSPHGATKGPISGTLTGYEMPLFLRHGRPGGSLSALHCDSIINYAGQDERFAFIST
jgi:hypothetical protein